MHFDLILHTKTANYIKAFLADPRQALLFAGPKGMGKKSIAKGLVNLFSPKKENIFNVIPVDSASIGIEEVRKIKAFLKLKSNQKGIQRFILICDADTMTEEAQNSLLKILEEPPDNTFFILTSSRPNILLPTIRSRLETHEIAKPPKIDIVDYLVSNYPGEDMAKIMALSAGLPGIAVALAKKERNVFLDDIQAAKTFFSSPVSDRFRAVDEYSKDRTRANDFLSACLTVCRAAMDAHIGSRAVLTQWAAKSAQIMRSSELLEKNVSTKLVLTELAVTL